MRRVILAGLALGALSRVEELTPGVSLGLSSDGAWLGTAFLAGLLAPSAPALRGAAALTAANAGYYLFIAATQTGAARTGIADVAGYWLVLGLAGGAVLGTAGAVAARNRRGPCTIAWLLPVGALMAEGGSSAAAGNRGGVVELALGCLLALGAIGRVGAAVAAAIGAVALTGALTPLVP